MSSVGSSTHSIDQISALSCEVRESISVVRNHLSRRWMRIRGETPSWVSHHIDVINRFERLIFEKGIDSEIYRNILRDAHKVTVEISNKIDSALFFEAIRPKGSFVDQHKLLKAPEGQRAWPLRSHEVEWNINASLLRQIYNRTQNEELKKKIVFLILNYLVKSAPAYFPSIRGFRPEDIEELKNRFQLAQGDEYGLSYNRESPIFDTLFSSIIESKFLSNSTSLLTSTEEISELLPLQFSVVEATGPEENLRDSCAEHLSQIFEHHFKSYGSDGYDKFIDPPILFDWTSLISEFIQTDGNEEKESLCEEKLVECKRKLNQAINKAVIALAENNPQMVKDEDDMRRLNTFIKANILCVCRSRIEEMGALTILPVLFDSDDYSLPEKGSSILKVNPPAGYDVDDYRKERFLQEVVCRKSGVMIPRIREFVNMAGLRPGTLEGRMRYAQVCSSESPVSASEYQPVGKNMVCFPKKEDFTQTALFKRLLERFSVHQNSYISILGRTSLDLIKGLLSEIPDEKWEALNVDPDTRQIIQTSLYRMMGHLATAEHKASNFSEFTQAIELVHCELSTLLFLLEPFKEQDFSEIYKQQFLKNVPEQFHDRVKCGMSKSAMNTFAGINLAVQKTAGDLKPEKAYGDSSYFEEVGFIGEGRGVRDVVENTQQQRIDLYVGEFNHNISNDINHEDYKPGEVIQDVETLIREKKDTEHLTVAIDCTIDFIHSEKSREILSHFSDEIESGKLNFVFFRSGQKFDMFGMDNYYGSAFSIVNNGEEYWSAFDTLLTSPALKTDPLSMQWFSLVYKYAPQSLDNYRRQIFSNTKAVLSRVPEYLKPGNNPNISVSTVSGGMEPCFIDIKVRSDSVLSEEEVEKIFFEKFKEKAKKFHYKGSFGFYHVNLNKIDDPKELGVNIRINPGLDPEENKIIIEALESISNRVHQLSQVEEESIPQQDAQFDHQQDVQVVEDVARVGQPSYLTKASGLTSYLTSLACSFLRTPLQSFS
jgi:hypothetical protein